MRRILKYSLAEAFLNSLSIRGVTGVLHVSMQGETPYIWVEVDEGDLKVHSFMVFPTGGYPEGRHVGSFLMDDGTLVWHLYELAA